MRMLRRGSGIICVILLCYSSFTNATQREKDAVLQTIEEFSGYPIQEPPPPSIPIPRTLKIHILDLQKQIDKLSTFSDTPAPSVTRILFTENDILARGYVKGLMNNAGLSVREDSVGNIFGRWIGCDPELAPVATGSHIDAIPHSGKYDGVVGVLGSIEAISALKRSGFRPKRSIEIIMFTSEEPTRFGISCLGSRLLSGSTTVEKRLGDMVDGENVSFVSSARAAGYAADLHGNFSTVFLKQGSYCAFLELHIEQGPLLEEEGISIGIVSAIAAPASISVTFRGNGGHAGALLMPFRNDAGLAAAELALAVEKHVLHSNSIDTVGTVGVMELHPGAINSIPSKARVEIDVRDIEELRRDDVVEKIHNSAKQIAARRGVELSELRVINQDPPATSDRTLVHMIEAVSVELNLTHKRIISRAYHDSLFMARISPMGMIFIPCYKGYSHKPEEYASIDDVGNGVRVLAFVLARLSLS